MEAQLPLFKCFWFQGQAASKGLAAHSTLETMRQFFLLQIPTSSLVSSDRFSYLQLQRIVSSTGLA